MKNKIQKVKLFNQIKIQIIIMKPKLITNNKQKI